jgi:hypothetical protein
MMRLAALVLAMLVCSVAGATAAFQVSLAQLSQRAELVVEADAGEAASFRIDGRIYTRTQVTVRESWKGQAPRTLSLVTRGGIVDGIGQRVDGESVLPTGTHAVLFLIYDEGLEGYRTLAQSQGSFVIADTIAAAAPRGLHATAARLTPADLTSFAQQVRAQVRDNAH